MAVTADRTYPLRIHPFHAILLAGTVPFFLSVLLSDFAYYSSYEVQWKNFSSWLLVGGLLFCGVALLWAVTGLFRPYRRGWRPIAYVLLLAAAFVLGFINALVHAMDVWASMPTSLILSAIVAVLVLVATGLGFSTVRARVTV